MADTFYQGDVGLKIELDCGQDISSSTDRAIQVRKPDGTTTSWAASLDGTDTLAYATASGDLSQAGTYKLQSSMSLGDWTGRGKTATLVVLPIFS
jgi:hypothetical protein